MSIRDLQSRFEHGESILSLYAEIQQAYTKLAGSSEDRGTAALLLGTYYYDTDPGLAGQFFDELAVISEKIGSERLLADVAFVRAMQDMRNNDFRNALAQTTRARDIAQSIGYTYRATSSLIVQASIAAFYSSYDQSISYLSEAVRVAREKRFPLLELRALGKQVELELIGKHAELAKADSLRCLELAEHISESEVIREKVRLATIAVELSEFDSVIELIRTVQSFLPNSARQLWCVTRTLHGKVHHSLGHSQLAREELQAALGLADYPGAARVRSNVRVHLAEVLLSQKAYQEALEQALASIADAKEGQDRFCQQDALKITHHCYKDLGQFELAYKYLEEFNALVSEGDSSDLKSRLEFYSMQNALAVEKARADREHQAAELLRLEIDLREREVNEQIRHRLNQAEALRQFRKDLRILLRQTSSNDPVAKNLREKLEDLPEESVDWLNYESQLTTLHPEFKSQLQSKYPSLTKQEIKICQLARLGLKSFETAKALSISERTVDNHRNAIRKKLQLRPEQSLSIFLQNI